MNPRLGAVAFLGALAACGSRSGFDDGTDDASVADAGGGGAIVPPALDSGVAPAALPDAAIVRPCHFVRTGDPFRTIAFDQPTYSFHQDGMLLRASGAGTHVVQLGSVEGIRTGVWDDPPIWAAEYDVATWPPSIVHPQTQLFQSMHDPADLVELPNGKLGLAWWFDNDGLGPHGVRYRTLDANSWALDPERFLVENAGTWTRLEPSREPDVFVSAYEMQAYYVDGGQSSAGWLGFFGADGAPRGEPLALWTNGSMEYGLTLPTATVARTSSDVLVGLAFPTCDEGNASPFCEARSIVILRVVAAGTGGAPHLEKASSVPVRDTHKIPYNAHLLSDGADHSWLTWWELDAPVDGGGATTERYLYGVPLTGAGALAGPIESFYVDEGTPYDYFPTRVPSIGPLGLVYPINRTIPLDGSSQREIHLVHRQLEATSPVEDITWTTPFTSFPVAVAQIASARSLVVAYSTYPDDSARGFGELVKYGCSEDAR